MYSHLRQGRSGGRVDWGWVPTSITWGLTSCRLQQKAFFCHGLIIKLLFSISHLGCNLNRQELHHPHNRIRGQGFGQGMVGLGHPDKRVMTMNQMQKLGTWWLGVCCWSHSLSPVLSLKLQMHLIWTSYIMLRTTLIFSKRLVKILHLQDWGSRLWRPALQV